MDPLSANTRLQAIEDFKTCLNECTTSTPPPPKACGRPYVRVSKLIRWLESETDLRGDKTTQTTRLLDYAYRNRRQQRIPMDRSKLFQAGNPCILVFVILLTMDWGWLVDRFHSSHLTDAKLPIDLATLKIKFKDMADRGILKNNNSSPDELAELFNRTQWKFCPAKFNGEYDEYWEKDRIIPINKKELISEKGGTAKLWQIAVLEDFVGPELRRLVPHARYDDKKDELGPVSRAIPKSLRSLLMITNRDIILHSRYSTSKIRGFSRTSGLHFTPCTSTTVWFNILEGTPIESPKPLTRILASPKE